MVCLLFRFIEVVKEMPGTVLQLSTVGSMVKIMRVATKPNPRPLSTSSLFQHFDFHTAGARNTLSFTYVV
jgi:hypothetical protein